MAKMTGPWTDHSAVRKAYPNVVTIDANYCRDIAGNEVNVDDAAVASARVTLDNETVANQYKSDRRTGIGTTAGYPNYGDQLDLLYKDLLAGKLDATGEWAKTVKAVKDSIPKP